MLVNDKRRKQTDVKTLIDILGLMRVSLEIEKASGPTIKESKLRKIADGVAINEDKAVKDAINKFIDEWTLDDKKISNKKESDDLSLDDMIKMSNYPGNSGSNYYEDHGGTSKVKKGFMSSRNNTGDDDKR